jgi:hypothetical protein
MPECSVEKLLLFMSVDRGVALLGMLINYKDIRKKAQYSDVMKILADYIQSPCFEPYALQTVLQLASSLLCIPCHKIYTAAPHSGRSVLWSHMRI